MFGTPKYMPPEQWSNSKNTIPQSDQWALAVIVFECITGVTPYDADDIPALVLKMSTEPPRSLRSVVPDAPLALEQVLTRALERDPQRRFPSVREFARMLLPFAAEATRARWSSEFEGSRGLDRADTLGIDRFTGPPRQTLAAGHSPTLQRSATELPAREPAPTSSRARLGAMALGLLATLGIAAAALLPGRDVTPSRAAVVPPVRVHRTEIPAPPPLSHVAERTDAGVPVAPPAPVAAIVAAAVTAAPAEPPRTTRHRAHRHSRSGHDAPAASAGGGEIPNL
jgi:serine/threonine-protein kinase